MSTFFNRGARFRRMNLKSPIVRSFFGFSIHEVHSVSHPIQLC